MKKFLALLLLLSFSLGAFGLPEALARTRPGGSNRPVGGNRPVVQRPRPQPNRPIPPRPPRPQPNRPIPPRPRPNRPIPPPPPRPRPPRPVYPYPPRYPHYNYRDARFSGWGLLWGLPLLLRSASSDSSNSSAGSTNEIPSYIPAETVTAMSGVEKLGEELKKIVEKDPVDKLKAMAIYSKIRSESQKIADDSFSEYLKKVNSLAPGEDFREPMTIPDDLPSEIRARMVDLQELARDLRNELRKRPVNKVKAIDLYSVVRRKGQEIADDRFYGYLDSVK